MRIQGQTIKVYPLVEGIRDSHGNARRSYGEPFVVENVLWAPLSPEDSGIEFDELTSKCRRRFYLPETDYSKFHNARIKTDDGEWDVEGYPKEYMAKLCPSAWRATVVAVKYER